MLRIKTHKYVFILMSAFLLMSVSMPQTSYAATLLVGTESPDSLSVAAKEKAKKQKEEAKKARKTERYEKKRAKKQAAEAKKREKSVARALKEQAKYEAKLAAMQPQRVYLFGGAINFLDSVAFVTDVQYIDSLYIEPDGELRESYAYSGQLKFYLESTYELKDETCAVYYELKEKKAVKRQEKMKAKLRKRGYFIHPVMKESFQFKDATTKSNSSN